MPGMILSFVCPCGFKKNNIDVGATETGHYSVYLCMKCENIFSVWTAFGKISNKKCRKCKTALIEVTDTGAWEPKSLQQKMPKTEPWMVAEELCELDEEDYFIDDFVEKYESDVNN